VNRETALGVIDQSEVLARLVDGDHVHVSRRVCGVCSDFAIDLDEALHDDLLDFTAIEGVLETVSDEDNERKAVTELVRAGGRMRSICTRELVEKPVRWRAQALLVLFPA
jgi:hypothetical protein